MYFYEKADRAAVAEADHAGEIVVHSAADYVADGDGDECDGPEHIRSIPLPVIRFRRSFWINMSRRWQRMSKKPFRKTV